MFITKSTARSPAPCPGPGKASDAPGVGMPRARCGPDGRESSPGCALQRRGTIGESSPPTPQCFSRALTLSPTLTALETKARSPWHFGHSILGSLRLEQAEQGVVLPFQWQRGEQVRADVPLQPAKFSRQELQ